MVGRVEERYSAATASDRFLGADGDSCQSIVQSIAHGPDILDHLMDSSNTVWLKNVVAPSVLWCYIRQIQRVCGDLRRRKSLCIFRVFIQGDLSSKCTDCWEAGCSDEFLKILKAPSYLIVGFFALRVEADGGRRLDFGEKHRFLVVCYGECRNNID